jgi:hypothetical protein
MTIIVPSMMLCVKQVEWVYAAVHTIRVPYDDERQKSSMQLPGDVSEQIMGAASMMLSVVLRWMEPVGIFLVHALRETPSLLLIMLYEFSGNVSEKMGGQMQHVK